MVAEKEGTKGVAHPRVAADRLDSAPQHLEVERVHLGVQLLVLHRPNTGVKSQAAHRPGR